MEIKHAKKSNMNDRLEIMRILECHDNDKCIDKSLLDAANLTGLNHRNETWVDVIDRKRKDKTVSNIADSKMIYDVNPVLTPRSLSPAQVKA